MNCKYIKKFLFYYLNLYIYINYKLTNQKLLYSIEIFKYCIN